MAAEVFMPKAGMDMKEGTIIRWLVNVGDQVSEGDGLLEIETDKVTMEVEAPGDGVLLCKYFEDGAVVPVVTVIGYVGKEGEEVPDGPTMAGGAAKEADEQMLGNKPKTEKQEKSGLEYDVAVIGGGPAGYIAAIKAAQAGGKVVIFEKDTVGGTCLNRGCIPTKTYVKTAEYLEMMRKASRRGINLDLSSIQADMAEIHAYKEKVVKNLTGGVAGLLKSNGITVVKEEASLLDKNTVKAGEKTWQADSIILCGGSQAGLLPIPGLDHPEVLTSDGILELKEIPGHLAIMGGGVIGCEIATAFRAFGSEVTVVELMDRLVPVLDREVSQSIQSALENMGIKIFTGKKVAKVAGQGGKPILCLDDGREIEADKVLVSIGRKADLSCLGAMKKEIISDKGKISVDDYCRTNFPNIYACGDLTSVSTLAHSAFKMGEAAAVNAMGGEQKADLSKVPSCLYTMPEAGCVGLTEDEAKARGEILVGKFPFSANGRAMASGETEGFVKVIADKKYGEILGVHIVGATAAEMITEAKVLMDMEITIYEAAEIMHPHPTCSEAFMEACADALGVCMHLPKKR